LVGDGGFLMTGNELATAMHCRLPVTVIVANNASYGSIRLNQEKSPASSTSRPSRRWASSGDDSDRSSATGTTVNVPW